jgi:hypothetical protein
MSRCDVVMELQLKASARPAATMCEEFTHMSMSQEHDVLLASAARKREQARRCQDLLRDLENAQAIIILTIYANELEASASVLEERARLCARDVA